MKIKVDLYIQAVKFSFCDDFHVQVSTHKSISDANTVVIDIDHDVVELCIPDFAQSDFTSGHVEQLKEVRARFLSDSQMQIKSIDEQIESLLAIEHKQGEQHE